MRDIQRLILLLNIVKYCCLMLKFWSHCWWILVKENVKLKKTPPKFLIFIFSGPHMPLGDICSGISFRYDDSIFVALAEPCRNNNIIMSRLPGSRHRLVLQRRAGPKWAGLGEAALGSSLSGLKHSLTIWGLAVVEWEHHEEWINTFLNITASVSYQ